MKENSILIERNNNENGVKYEGGSEYRAISKKASKMAIEDPVKQ